MSDVEVFYADLNSAASTVHNAKINLQSDSPSLSSSDTGVENPAGRASLEAELGRRIAGLRELIQDRVLVAEDLAALLWGIAAKYEDLDVELTGKDQP